MAAFETLESWIVYRITFSEKTAPMNGVCPQDEWAEMKLKTRGQLTLIQSGISSEGEAEKIARGTAKVETKA